MSKLIRYHTNDQIIFITAVAHERASMFIEYYDQLRESINKYRREMKFKIPAFVALPDHVHILINPGGTNVSLILQRIKLSFSKKVRYLLGQSSGQIWQKRFWDHIIRNQEDMNKHIDYIHYNPVKHGYTNRPHDWKYSTFPEYYKRGYYSEDWGEMDPLIKGEFGE